MSRASIIANAINSSMCHVDEMTNIIMSYAEAEIITNNSEDIWITFYFSCGEGEEEESFELLVGRRHDADPGKIEIFKKQHFPHLSWDIATKQVLEHGNVESKKEPHKFDPVEKSVYFLANSCSIHSTIAKYNRLPFTTKAQFTKMLNSIVQFIHMKQCSDIHVDAVHKVFFMGQVFNFCLYNEETQEIAEVENNFQEVLDFLKCIDF